MPAIPTSNNGSTFYNKNDCRSFKQTITTSLTQLSAYPCSEVVILNKTTGDLSVYDNNYTGDDNAFLLGTGESFTFRGITNSNMVSAIAASPGAIYYRTQFYSVLPQR